MKITTIVFSMMGILAALFVFGKLFAPKERKKMGLEAEYAEALFAFKNSGSEEDKKKVVAVAERMKLEAGKSEEAVSKLLENDLA